MSEQAIFELPATRLAGDVTQLGPARSIRRVPNPRVSVVIPTLNEAQNLPHVFARLPADIFEIVLVDGHSTDGTVELARELFPDVRIVGQTRRGKGNALACGFAAARGDVIVMLDADGSARPEEIPAFVAALCNGADFAKGSRFVESGGSSDITIVRRLGNAFFTGLVNILHGTRYTDLCYGYNAFWTDCLPVLDVDCDGFEVETLINIRAAKAGLVIAEVPSFEDDRRFGESNLRPFRDGWRVLTTIFRELRRPRELVDTAAAPARTS
jgi:glycosyltransferase involved in cell wall biosynthesis